MTLAVTELAEISTGYPGQWKIVWPAATEPSRLERELLILPAELRGVRQRYVAPVSRAHPTEQSGDFYEPLHLSKVRL